MKLVNLFSLYLLLIFRLSDQVVCISNQYIYLFEFIYYFNIYYIHLTTILSFEVKFASKNVIFTGASFSRMGTSFGPFGRNFTVMVLWAGHRHFNTSIREWPWVKEKWEWERSRESESCERESSDTYCVVLFFFFFPLELTKMALSYLLYYQNALPEVKFK